MTEVSQRLSQANSTDIHNITFSAALAAGLTHSGWLVDPTTDPSGQEAALASHSALPEKVEVLKTSVTFGPLFGGSSHSAGLQSSLASKLRQRMGVNGSPEYELTWKSWDMKSGPPICALRASGRRISGNGCSGWQAPKASDSKGPSKSRDVHLNHQAALSGWPTCSTRDSKGGYEGGRIRNGKISTDMLDVAAQLAGWPTPLTITGGPESAKCKQELGRKASGGWNLQTVVQMSGWPTPTQDDSSNATRESGDYQSLTRTARGAIPSSSPAPMAKPEGCRLNELFSLWLQGYPPAEWASCAVRVTQSSRK